MRTTAMNGFFSSIVLPGVFALLLVTLLGGCATTSSPAQDPANIGQDAYYDEFGDVPIPIDMTPEKDRFTIMGKGGIKLGIEEFSGRVDKTSLVNAMQTYMARDGWTLRSLFRANRSIMVFEKPDRICTLYFTESSFSTTMLVFVSPLLQPGDVAYRQPLAAPVVSEPSAGVQSYPEGGFSNASEQLSY